MINKKLAAACVGAAAVTLTSISAHAAPSVYGVVGARVLDQEDRDRSVQAYDVRLGIKGAGKYADVTAMYQLEVDYTGSANGDATTPDGGDELQVRNARLVFPTKVGAFVIAPKTPSSQFSTLYGAINIFETNNMAKGEGPATIFDQGETSTHVLAYSSPRKAGFKGLLSYLTANETNGVDGDYITWWVDWEANKEGSLGGFRAAVGQVFIDKKAIHPAATKDATRTTYTLGYTNHGVHLGATYEDYDLGGFAGQDRKNYGLVASYTSHGYTLGVGRFDRDLKESDAADNSGTVISLKKQIDENLLFFVEKGNFDQDGQSSVSAGAKLKF